MIELLLLLAQVQHQHHPPRSAEEYAKVLEDPSRDAWQKPHDVVQALGLRADEVVADLGAGSGYFARRLARHAGKVLAVDIDAKLLERAKSGAPANVDTVLATADDPKLDPASVDTIFLCNVLHHIDNRGAYYGKLAAALKPGGRVVVIDFHKRKLAVGPPPEMKLSAEEVQKELAGAGFRLTKSHTFLPHQYFLEFQRAKQWREEAVAPGIVYRHAEYMVDGKAPVLAHVVEFDPATPGIDLVPVRAQDKLAGKEAVSSIARRNQALVAVNAGYFVVAGPYAGAPVSAYELAGKLLAGSTTQVATGIPGAPLSGNPQRTALVVCQPDGEVERLEMDMVRFRGSVTLADGERRGLAGLNRPRVADDLVLFTAPIGKSTFTGADGLEVALDAAGRAVRMELGFGNVAVPEGGSVVSASGAQAEWIRARVKLGDTLRVDYGLARSNESPSCAVRYVVAAGPRLVRGGRLAEESEGFLHEKNRNPRTAIGVTARGTILLYVVDGRRANSVGMTVAELAAAMLELGAVEAMNLDGGGSSTMVVGGRVVNQPADGRERPVSDAIVLRPAPK